MSLLLALLLAAPARAADVFIGLEAAASGGRPKLAVPPVEAADPRDAGDSLLASQVRDLLRDDLLFSRHFEVVTDGPPSAGLSEAELREAWGALARGAVLGAVSGKGDKLALEFRLLDFGSGETLAGRRYRTSDWRHAVHSFADEVVQRLTGRRGIARTRIAFSNDQSGAKEIYAADYDGGNLKRLTDDRSIAILPRWSRDGSRVFYTTWRWRNPDLYSVPSYGGEAQAVSTRPGLNMAGGLSPEGDHILVTLTDKNATDIFQLRLGNHRLTRLTDYAGIDSSPTFSPDGRQVAFVSDRSGNPQIYVMEANTGRTRRLTNLNWCDSPAWSPSGEWIAFAGRPTLRHKLDIYLVDLTGSQLRRLTRDAGSNEDPSWSPDGRYLAFTSTRGGRRQIHVMDADGSAPHVLLDVPGNSQTPAWSD